MANPFETLPKESAEKPVQKPEEAQEEEKKIEVVSEIGGRKRTPEEIERYKRIREEVETEKKIREKLKSGKLLTKEEVAFLRAEEITRKLSEEEKEISPQNLEKNLEEKRNVYIEADKEYREKFGKMKKKESAAFEEAIESARKYIKAEDIEILKDEKSPQYSEAVKRKEDFIEELTKKGIKKEKAEAIYNVELKKVEYDEAKKELGEKMLAEGKNEAEIFQKLILEEREVLNKAKIESWPPKEKNLFRKGLEWYMRKGTATRLLISTGLVTGVVAATGGFSAPAIALFAGQRYLKGAAAVLLGKLAGKGVDWVMEKNIRAKEEAALSKLKEEFSLENLEKVDKEYEKILEEVAGKRRTKLIVKAGVMAATGAGVAIGLSLAEGSLFAAPKPEVPEGEVPSPSKAPTGEVLPEAKAPAVEISGIETAKPGDSIWKMTERQLEVRYGEKFTSLDEARKTYVIDAIKDKVAENPGKFGLTDIDEIKTGQKVDFSGIFEDKTEVDKFFEKANALTESQIKNIAHNNEALRNWLREHPGQKLTSEKIEEILAKGKIIPAEAAPAKAVPTETAPAEAVPEAKAPAVEAAPEKEELAGEEVDVRVKYLEELMNTNETANVKTIGLTPGEYEVLKNLKVGKLLEQIPSKEEAWAIWKGEVPGKAIDLPHYGLYNVSEFERQIKLAEFIRSFKPGSEIQEMTIGQFFRMLGPNGTIIMTPEGIPAEITPEALTPKEQPEVGVPEKEIPEVPPEKTPEAPDETPLKEAPPPETTPTKEVPTETPKPEEAPTETSKPEELIAGLTREKQNYLDGLVRKDSFFEEGRVYVPEENVIELAEKIKKGELTVEDFGNYYAHKALGAKRLSPELMKNLEDNFKMINEGSGKEWLKAKKAIHMMLMNLREKLGQ